ncbi:MAG: gas vesicle protein GvpG [Vicinamibacterales bacterium]
MLDKVAIAAETELHDDTAVREQLLEAQMQLELGEISEEEFGRVEAAVFERLRALRVAQPHGLTLASPEVRVTGIEATVAGDSHED